MKNHILHLMKERVVICRLTRTTGAKMVFTTTTATLAHKQPLAAEKAQLFNGAYGKTFRIYIPPSADVVEGDRLTDTDGEHYIVKKAGMTRHAFGSIDFKECIIELVT